MAYSLTYAGVPLRVVDPETEARILSTFGGAWREEFAHVHPGGNLDRLSVPSIADPPIRLNEWFYPVGASRWSSFRCLVDAATALDVEELVFTAGSVGLAALTVESGIDATQTAITSYMMLLPPKSIADGSLYLMTFVDRRYFRQFEGFKSQPTGTWADLIGSLLFTNDTTGASGTVPTIDAVYGVPEPDSALYSSGESSACLLDAAAANVGLVVVRTLAGSYTLQRLADARTGFSRPGVGYRLAGGLYFDPDLSVDDPPRASAVPTQVSVFFPRWVDGVGFYEATTYRTHVKDSSYGDVTTKNILTADLDGDYATLPTYPGVAVIRTTAKARYSSSPPSDPADNDADMEALSERLAKDFIDSQLLHVDEVYRGIHPIPPSAVGDLCWDFRSCTTRISRPPFGFVRQDFQHAFSRVASIAPYSFTAREIDGSPSTTEGLNFPNSSLEDAGDGTANVREADATHGGLISLGDQILGDGEKILQDGLQWSAGGTPQARISTPALGTLRVSSGAGSLANGQVEAENFVGKLNNVTYPSPYDSGSGIGVRDDRLLIGVADDEIDALPELVGGVLVDNGSVDWLDPATGSTGDVLTLTFSGLNPSVSWEAPTGDAGSAGDIEAAQDAVGTILADSSTIDFTYNDATPSITADVKSASIAESHQTLSDVTTLDVSTTKHGYCPKLPNSATKFLDGVGAWRLLAASDLPTGDWITANYAEATLSSDYTISATNTWYDPSVSVSLSAGKWLLITHAQGYFAINNVAGTSEGFLWCRLYNSTDSAAITNSEFLLGQSQYPTVHHVSSANAKIVTLTGTKTIRLECARGGGGTFTASVLKSDGTYGRTNLLAIKIDE